MTKLVNRLPLKWPGTGHVNMTEFFSNTSPMYYVTHCKLEHIDCRKYWRKVLTLNGACIEFDPILAIQGSTLTNTKEFIGSLKVIITIGEWRKSHLMSAIMHLNSSKPMKAKKMT